MEETVDLNITYWRRTIADRIKEKIDSFATDNADDGFRTHLGWSVIGHKCSRYLWYHWRWFWREVFDGRRERIFIAGHQIEAEMRFILKAQGAKFLDTVDEDRKQIKVSDFGGHFGGSVDGVFVWPEIGLNDPTLLEVKSSKTGAPFNDLEKLSVSQAKPQHYVQQSGYGKKLGIRYAAYICRNKNDSSIYVEIVDLDWSLADEYTRRAKFVILETVPPKKISEKPNFFICNMCAIKPLCQGDAQPVPNCRNCENATPMQEGGWHCKLYNQELPKDFIPKGCANHKFLPWK